jgi:hypothetical protein
MYDNSQDRNFNQKLSDLAYSQKSEEDCQKDNTQHVNKRHIAREKYRSEMKKLKKAKKRDDVTYNIWENKKWK